MKIVVVVANYPFCGYEFSGVFNERSVSALKRCCEAVEVLAPRPYVPSWLAAVSRNLRWKSYAKIPAFEVRDGVRIHRPPYIRVPRVAGALWAGFGAFVATRRVVRAMHDRVGFDAMLAFDLVAAGGLAWRLARDLGIPVGCWATGERIDARTVERFDLVFYQSRALFETASRLRGRSADPAREDRHVVLARGVPEPPPLARGETRRHMRDAWGVGEDEIVVLSLGRVERDKGVFELLDAMASVRRRARNIVCVIVGSTPAFDETAAVRRKLEESAELARSVRLLPACAPSDVWNVLSAADLFAFPSHHEGMPNALLEAMAMGVPAVAFAIPPVLEIEGGTAALVSTPPLDVERFADAIVRLARSAELRAQIGEEGRRQVARRFMADRNMAEAVRHIGRVIRQRAEGCVTSAG